MKAASRTNSTGLLSSLRSLWAIPGDKKMYGPYERPPFPIKVDTPTWGDIGREYRMSDFVMGMSVYWMGHACGFIAGRPFPMLM